MIIMSQVHIDKTINDARAEVKQSETFANIQI